MPNHKGPPEPRTRRGPGRATPGPRSVLTSTDRHSSDAARHPGPLAVLDTCARQVDGLAGLGSDALVHAEPLRLDDMVRACDVIGRRLGAAVAGLGGRP